MESTANKVGYVVMEKLDDKGKARKISAPFLSHAAAEEFVALAERQGLDVFIVGPGEDGGRK